jgi:hypothetical protein
MNRFDSDDGQPREEELLEEGIHFGKRRHRRSSQSQMEAMSYDAAMPVSPRDPAREWRSIVEEHDWMPAQAPPDPAFAEAMRKAFGGSTATAILAGVSLYVMLAGYGGAGSRRSA